MHVLFAKKPLVAAIKSSIRFTSELSSNAALSGIRFVANADGVFLETSNQLASVRVSVPGAVVKKEGSALLKGSLLSGVVPKIKSEEIDFNAFEENKLAVSAGSYLLELNIMDESTFPVLDFATTDWDKYELQTDFLVSVASRIAPAASTDESRMVQLTGVNLTLADGRVRASATDSFKFLSNVYSLAGKDFDLIIRKATLDFVKDMVLERKLKGFSLFVKNKSVLFALDDLIFKSETIEGKYPSIDKVLSIESKTDLQLDRNELLDVLDRGNAIGNNRAQVLNLELEQGFLTFSFRNAGVASSSERIAVDNPGSAVERVSLNAAYLMIVAQAVTTAKIHVCLNGKDRPVKLYNPDEPDFTGIVVNLVAQ